MRNRAYALALLDGNAHHSPRFVTPVAANRIRIGSQMIVAPTDRHPDENTDENRRYPIPWFTAVLQPPAFRLVRNTFSLRCILARNVRCPKCTLGRHSILGCPGRHAIPEGVVLLVIDWARQDSDLLTRFAAESCRTADKSRITVSSSPNAPPAFTIDQRGIARWHTLSCGYECVVTTVWLRTWPEIPHSRAMQPPHC